MNHKKYCESRYPSVSYTHLVKIAGNAVDKAFISGNKSKCGSIFNIVALLVDDDLAGPVTVVFLYKTFIVVSLSLIHIYSLIIFCGSMIVNNELSHFTALIAASMLLNINSAVNCLIIGDTRISSASNQYSGYIKVFMKNANILSIACLLYTSRCV